MGASNAKSAPEEDPLSPEERDKLKALFQKVAASSNAASKDKLQTLLEGRVSGELLDMTLTHLAASPMTFHRLAAFYVHSVRGSVDEQAAILVAMASGGGKTCTSGQLVAVVEAVAASYLQAAAGQAWSKVAAGPIGLLAAGLCHDLLFPGKQTKETLLVAAPEEVAVTETEAAKWLAAAPPGLLAMQAAVFEKLFLDADPKRPLPTCRGLPDAAATVLDQAAVAFLAACLPSDFCKEWRFLFSSAIHGESFSKMMGSAVWQGPTIVVVRDSGGHLFGGFAVAPWNPGPKFVGDNRCFLFNLRPKMAIYPTSGYNDHFQYLNVQQQTMPNGLGMGGQLEYFGLYLDASYGKGFCSESCTTYHSPMMSSSKQFEVSHLEVWAVGPPPPPPEELGERPSVLDLDNEAKAILAMAGKEQKSDGWREPEEPQVYEHWLPENMTCTGFPGPGDKHVYTFNPMREFVHNYEGHVDEAFEHFKRTHSRQYPEQSEHGKRKDIFRQNLRYIHSKNRAGLGFQLAVNHLADKSELEMKALRGRQHSEGFNGGLAFPYEAPEAVQVPEAMDWRIFGAVTPVKDQSVCGSCWSFGTTGAIEGAYYVKYGHLVRISQQALIDCSWGYGNNGCDGGEDFRSYQWMMKHGGIPTEDEYGPYLGQDGYCHADNVTLTAKITGYVNVTSGSVDALKVAVAKHGPISVAIDASHRTFSFYSNGVYYEPQCGNTPEQLDHAVLVVGYGTINGKGYWLVKNSWSNYWGNDGYVLMAQQDNNCGVTTDPTYVLM